MNIKAIYSTATLLHCADYNVMRNAENVSGPHEQNTFQRMLPRKTRNALLM
jgi:hypothetical protein